MHHPLLVKYTSVVKDITFKLYQLHISTVLYHQFFYFVLCYNTWPYEF